MCSLIYAVENRDYQQTRSIVTFEKEVREISKLVKILDNSNLEGTKSFSVMITAISGLYPVSVINSTAIVEINDDDCKCCMYHNIFSCILSMSEIEELSTSDKYPCPLWCHHPYFLYHPVPNYFIYVFL